MKLKHIIERVLSIPKSFWVSLHYFSGVTRLNSKYIETDIKNKN